MVIEERYDHQEEDKRLVPAASQGIAAVQTKRPLAPGGLTDEEAQELQARSVDL